MAIANAQSIHSTDAVVFVVTNVISVKVTERTDILTVHDAIAIAVVETVFPCFVVVAEAVLVHVDAVIVVVTDAVRI